jgi:predicted nucleic acid-binding protein
MARRTHLKPEDKQLLERIRGQQWTVDELRWVLTHLDAGAPTLVIQELHAKLIAVSASPNANSLNYEERSI